MKELIIELTKEEEMQIFGGRVVYEIININGKAFLIISSVHALHNSVAFLLNYLH